MKNLGLFGCMVTLLLASACNKDEELDSPDIRTSGIYPEFTVLATGNGKSSVSVTLKVEGNDSNTTLILLGEDKLVCTAAEQEETLDKDDTEYKATFDTDEGGTKFVFSLIRGDEDEDAPNSYVTLPEPFELDGVDSTEEVSRADGTVELTWDASDDNDTSTWEIEGDCLSPHDGNVSTDGKLVLSGGDEIEGDAFSDDEDATEEEKNCKATVCVERRLVGKLDSAFSDEEGGEIRAIQRRCKSFMSVP